tara:strand:- start:183 stop:722 length:540 start_codon:yes stop_codon:yes gene_type:complete
MSASDFLQQLIDGNMDERGANLFTSEGGNVAFFKKVSDTQYFQFAFTPGNSPAIESGIVDMTDVELVEHINENLDTWHVIKCQLDEIYIEDGLVHAPMELTIHWGEVSTREQNPPVSYTFKTQKEEDAFIDGVDAAIDVYPGELEDDADLDGYDNDERAAFVRGLEAAEGYSEYVIVGM